MKTETLPSDITNIDFDRIIYALSALNDVTEEIISTVDVKTASAKILKIIMGTLGVTKGLIMLYVSTRASFEVIADKGFESKPYMRGFEDKLHLKVSNKEITENFSNTSYMFYEQLSKECPDFVQKNEHFLETEGFQLFYPLFIRNKFIGAILLGENSARTRFLQTELFLLSIMARQASISLQNFQLIEDLQKEKEKYLKETTKFKKLRDIGTSAAGISQISVDLSDILNEDKFLDSFIEGALISFGATSGIVCKVEDYIEGEVDTTTPLVLEVMATKKMPDKKITHLPKNKMITCQWDDLFGNSIKQGDTVISDVPHDFLNLRSQYGICVPLKVKDPSLHKEKKKITGILALFDKESREGFTSFSDTDKIMLAPLANQGSVLWENARLYQEATLDGLTKLYVRRFWERRLYEEVKKALRYRKPLSLIMIDIDHFKKFNDTYGHQTGDEVLKEVAAQISKSMRQGIDVAARYGGEEISVIMPETDLDGGMIMAERLRDAIAKTQLPNPNPLMKPLSVTISLGVATLPILNLDDKAKAKMTQEAWHELVLVHKQHVSEYADIALYESKKNGRNKVTPYTEKLG